MNTKVIGIGLNRTGTTTLGACFRQLGYRHTSMHHQAFQLLQQRDMPGLLRIVGEYDSFEDWPWPLIYREIDQAFPDSKFILTRRRTPEVWFRSLCRLADMTGPTPYRQFVYGHAMPHHHQEEHIAYYQHHNEAARDYFSGQPGKLLELAWEDGHGWPELCDFLGKPVPDVPLPWANRSDGLEAIMRDRLQGRGQSPT
jgi:hypothetical protein